MSASFTSAFFFTAGGPLPAGSAGWAAQLLPASVSSIVVLSLSARGGAFAQVRQVRPAAVHVPVCGRILSGAGSWPTVGVVCPAGGPRRGSHCWSLISSRAAAGQPTVVVHPPQGATVARWLARRGFQPSAHYPGVWLLGLAPGRVPSQSAAFVQASA